MRHRYKPIGKAKEPTEPPAQGGASWRS
jgi:hypothetical protein